MSKNTSRVEAAIEAALAQSMGIALPPRAISSASSPVVQELSQTNTRMPAKMPTLSRERSGERKVTSASPSARSTQVHAPSSRAMPSIELSSAIIGAAIEVHRQLGPGLLEGVYERALMIELAYVGLRASSQVPITLKYRGHTIGEYVADVVVEDCIVVELKAIATLAKVHVSTLLSYLRASGLRLGLLINFNVPVLHMGVQRIAL